MRYAVLLVVVACASHESSPTIVATVTSPPVPPPPATTAVASEEASLFDYVAHPERDDGVSREYSAVDEQLRSDFDYDSGKLRFTWLTSATGMPSIAFPSANARTAFDAADRYASSLARLVAQQPSPKWAVMLLAREASVHESVWLALKEMPNALTPSQQATLRRMRPARPDTADDIEDFAERPRKLAMDEAARKAVGMYAWALAFSRASHVTALQDDLRTRLTVFRRLLGSANFENMVTTAPPPRGVGRASAWLTLEQVGEL